MTKEKVSDFSKKNNSEVFIYMKDHVPEFDLEHFEQEMQFIFEELYSSYLKHDIEGVEEHASYEGRGFFEQKMEIEKAQNLIHKHTNIFGVSRPSMVSSMMVSNIPLFVFSVRFYDLHCLVEKADTTKVAEGNEFKKNLNDYLLWVTLNEDPDLEKSGHRYSVIKVYEQNKVALLL